MAVFRLPEDHNRLDWRLLQCSPITLYFSRDLLTEHVDWFREQAYQVRSFDCAACPTEASFHQAVGQTLGLPASYGGNLDSFNDYLGQLEVPDASGTALVFVAFDCHYRQSPNRAWAFLDVIAGNARQFLLTGQRLLALVQSDDPTLDLQEVGACPVMVNPAEFGRRQPPIGRRRTR
jgi:RNAse (barnase) inhibitor barstar